MAPWIRPLPNLPSSFSDTTLNFNLFLLKSMLAKGKALPTRIAQKESSFEVRDIYIYIIYIMSERDEVINFGDLKFWRGEIIKML